MTRKQIFKDLTTRKHYAGHHQLNIIINGEEKAHIPFILHTPAPYSASQNLL